MQEPEFSVTVNGKWVQTLRGLGHYRLEFPCDDGTTLYIDMECGMQPPKPLYQDRDWLNEQYVVADRTMAEIAREFGVTPMTINQWLRSHDIPTRPRGRRKNS